MVKSVEKIFSITNSSTHKVVRVFGMIFKFKSKVNMLCHDNSCLHDAMDKLKTDFDMLKNALYTEIVNKYIIIFANNG